MWLIRSDLFPKKKNFAYWGSTPSENVKLCPNIPIKSDQIYSKAMNNPSFPMSSEKLDGV